MGATDGFPKKLFYIYVSVISRKAVRLSRHIAIAQTTKPTTVVYCVHAERRQGSPLVTPEIGNHADPVPENDAKGGSPNADVD